METVLAKTIKDKIRKHGPITFRDFMELALYDPEHGFYTKGPGIGTRAGAFNTNAMFPAFAFALARAIQHAEGLVEESLRIVEFGGGTAALASNLRSFLSTPHEYVIVDISPGFRAQQTQRGFHAIDSVDSLHPAPTFAFGNEVLDALPVHRVMGNGFGELLEFFVWIDGKGDFIEQPDIPSTPLLAERLRSEGIILGRGQIAEISKGYLLFIDYGEEASSLYSHSHRNGTLRSFRSQQAVFNPFESVGDQDLTADVDFTALKRAARKAGLQSTGCLRQGTWLNNIGIQDYTKVVENIRSAEEEIFFLTSPARLGSTFDVALFKTEGIPDGCSLHLC
jgi:SAM-dependent MidA family methyltransferase